MAFSPLTSRSILKVIGIASLPNLSCGQMAFTNANRLPFVSA
jgi:hypothetical protein